MINLNTWAKEITLKEGKKINLSIAQVKEVLKIILIKVKGLKVEELLELLKRIK